MPIWKAEDVFSGNDEALMQLIQKLISKGTPTNLLDAKLLAVRNNLENLLLEEYRNAIQNIEPKQYLSGKLLTKLCLCTFLFTFRWDRFKFKWDNI